MPTVINLLRTGEFEVKKEAGWTVANMTSGGTMEQIMYLVDNGAIAGLTTLMEAGDERVITVAMDAFGNILDKTKSHEVNHGLVLEAIDECGGVAVFRDLTVRAN
jgi:hypothetical protein